MNQTVGKYRYGIIISCTQRCLADIQSIYLCILLSAEQHRFDPSLGLDERSKHESFIYNKKKGRGFTDISGQIDSTVGYKVMNSVLYTHRLFLKSIFVLV